MSFKRCLGLLCALCLLLGLLPGLAQTTDRLTQLGAWEAFEPGSEYRKYRYDNLYYDEAHGVILVILYDRDSSSQRLVRLDRVGGRWKVSSEGGFFGPSGEVGTLTFMNSEEPAIAELVHSQFEGEKGYFESFWFKYQDGDYRFSEALLTTELKAPQPSEQGLRLWASDQGIMGQAFTYVRESPAGREAQGEARLLAPGRVFNYRTRITDYPRDPFLPMLASQGLLFAAPRDLPRSAAQWVLVSPWSGWQVTGWAQPTGGDEAFLVVRQGQQNTLLGLRRLGDFWELAYVNDKALPQGPVTFSLGDASGSMLLVPYQPQEGPYKENYGRALSVAGNDGNGEYAVRHSIWERDQQGRWLLSFYGHEGQSGMLQFDPGRVTYLEPPRSDQTLPDHTQRDLQFFDYAQLPDPYGVSRPGNDAVIAVVNNPRPQDRLNLRKEPRTSADMIGRYYNGVPVQVLEDQGGDWVQVWIGWDRKGYMMRQYLAFGEEGRRVASAMPVYAMDQPWDLYYEPFAESNIKERYPGGQRVEVMGLMGGWWHVRLQGEPETIGFIPQIEPL